MTQLVQKIGSRPPWVGLGAAILVQFASGNPYTFPLFSPALKSVLGFNQQQITILGVAADIGENAGILPGIVCNKFHPWVVLCGGAFACFWGFGLIWLTVTQTIQNLPYWLLWIALLVGTNSSAWFSTTVIVTNMRNFPLHRGTIAGLLKGYSGLSTAIYAEIFSLTLDKSASSLLLFLTLGLPILCCSMMYLIRLCTPATASLEDSSHKFLFIQASSVLLGVYLLATKIIDSILALDKSICYMFIAIMFTFMIAPLAIPVKMTVFPRVKKLGGSITDPLLPQTSPVPRQTSEDEETGTEEDYPEPDTDIDTLLAIGEGAVVKRKRRPRRGEDFKFKEAIIKADFWLLWLVYFLGAGSGVTALNNLAQVGSAQGDGVDTTLLVSLFSFCNFIGRLGGGAVSEYFVRRNSVPRTIWMSFTQAIMCLSFLLYTSTLSSTLYIATALIGIGFGVQFTTMIPTASELFGLKNFGVIYNFILLGNPIGALLFSGLLAGYIYDAEAIKQGASTCLGSACFRLTFLVLAALCGVGTMLGLYLSLRIRPVYQMLYSGGSSHHISSLH